MKAPVYVPLFSVVACAFATVYCSVGVCQFIPATPDFAHERAMRDVEAWAIGTLISIALLIWSAAVLWKRSRPFPWRFLRVSVLLCFAGDRMGRLATLGKGQYQVWSGYELIRP